MKLSAVFLACACSWASVAAMAADYTTKTVTVGVRKNMEATLYTPNGPGPFPMVVVLHTSGGLETFDLAYCGSLAKEGYICIAPAFLRAHAITEEIRQKAFTTERSSIMDDFREIIGELNALPQAKQGAVGAVGFSNGGYFTALLAARQEVRAAVSYYGALDGAHSQPDLPAFKKRFTKDSAPLLVLAGENDGLIGTGPPKLLEQIMKDAGARYEIKFYPGVGHRFDRQGGNPEAAADAWQRTLAFLRANGV
jgi:carboxymethylenebutenolidase